MLYALLLSMTNDTNKVPFRLIHEQAVETLLWSESINCPDTDEELGSYSDYLCFDDVPEVALSILGELLDFLCANKADLAGLDYTVVAHKYILSRNGHGTGLWDMGLGERGERLHAAAKKQGEVCLHSLLSADAYECALATATQEAR